MAASDYSIPYPYLVAMATGPGAQNADVASPWLPSAPPIQHHQIWDPDYSANSQPLPPAFPYRHSQYPQPNYSQSPYPSFPPYSGYHMQMYPPSMYPFSAHQPRPPPAIRSGHVDALISSPGSGPDVHRGPASYELYRRDSHESPAYSMPPHPPAPINDTPNSSLSEQQSSEATSGGGIEHFSQTRPVGPIPSDTDPFQHADRSRQRRAIRHSLSRRIEEAEQRALRNPSAQARRSDRSSSPRTSARRSYNRYSADLSQSSISSDIEEAAARSPPGNRIRHQRTDSRPRFIRQTYDPRIITSGQLQQLKAGLPKLLKGDLPKETTPACDICAKDYSAISVQPSEEEEVAIKLPCGHCFGEYCIAQWVRIRFRFFFSFQV